SVQVDISSASQRNLLNTGVPTCFPIPRIRKTMRFLCLRRRDGNIDYLLERPVLTQGNSSQSGTCQRTILFRDSSHPDDDLTGKSHRGLPGLDTTKFEAPLV